MTKYVARHHLERWPETRSTRWMIWFVLLLLGYLLLVSPSTLGLLLGLLDRLLLTTVTFIYSAGWPSWLVIAGVATGVRAARMTDVDRLLAGISARRLTALAVLLAGRKRSGLRTEWDAHLVGESGHDPLTWPKAREAFGFVASATRCRCSDAADAAWTPIDAILKSRTLSNLLVFGPTITVALFIFHQAGKTGVVTSAGGIFAVGGALYALVRVGRWWRNVEPPEPKARRAKE